MSVITKERQLLEQLEKYDTPSITNVVATYPEDTEHCLGLYHPWESNWYTDASCKCMFPQLGPIAGYVVTVTFGLPDLTYTRKSFSDLYQVIEHTPKPVIIAIKQNLPKKLKNKNGLCGGNMMTAFKSLGVVGVISDGPSRDISEVRPMGIQYMLTGTCAGHGPFVIQEINTPVEICGMDTMPGEIIHMDENGAVKFPSVCLSKVVDLCEKLHHFELEKQLLLSKNNNPELLAQIMADQYQ